MDEARIPITWAEWALNADPEAVKAILDDRWRWITAHQAELRSGTLQRPPVSEWMSYCWYCGAICDPYHGSDADVWGNPHEPPETVHVCKRPDCQQSAEQEGMYAPRGGE